MAKPSTRQGLIDYCLRQLGAPVLEINVDDDQIDDLVDDTRWRNGTLAWLVGAITWKFYCKGI